ADNRLRRATMSRTNRLLVFLMVLAANAACGAEPRPSPSTGLSETSQAPPPGAETPAVAQATCGEAPTTPQIEGRPVPARAACPKDTEDPDKETNAPITQILFGKFSGGGEEAWAILNGCSGGRFKGYTAYLRKGRAGWAKLALELGGEPQNCRVV